MATAFDSLLENSILNSQDANEVKLEFEAYRVFGIGFSIGFCEERWNYEVPFGSKEWKLANKIKQYSYEYHKLDDNFEYVNKDHEAA